MSTFIGKVQTRLEHSRGMKAIRTMEATEPPPKIDLSILHSWQLSPYLVPTNGIVVFLVIIGFFRKKNISKYYSVFFFHQEYFENPAFRPDGLKIYPTLVIRGTGLYELWKTGRYKSYPPGMLIDLVARILALVPPWTRVYRVQRLVNHV